MYATPLGYLSVVGEVFCLLRGVFQTYSFVGILVKLVYTGYLKEKNDFQIEPVL